ncbi:hypothetical protein [Streptomyces sp. NPDC001292]|uniref:hypothetical protein n=1 Tax=Streptomyces sp. NPDC001292 TaxID=3364558 RepID=UPI0036850A40
MTGETAAEQEQSFVPTLSPFKTFYAAFVAVRSVKSCARTAHTTVTEKYDGGAAHTACGRLWEAA